MDIEKVAELVLSQYNSEKKLHGKADFAKIVNANYKRFELFIDMTGKEFFKAVSTKCHEKQPPSYPRKHKLKDSTFLLKDAIKRVKKEYFDLGNGDIELGQEFYELYQFG